MNNIIKIKSKYPASQKEEIEKAIADATDGDAVFFEGGKYFVDGKINIINKKNLIICGEDATIVAHFDASVGFWEFSGILAFKGCKNITLKKLIFDTDNPVNCSGSVVDKDTENTTVDVMLYDGCTLDGSQTIFASCSLDEDGSPDYLFADTTKRDYTCLPNNTVKIQYAENVKAQIERLPIGADFVIRHGLGNFKVLDRSSITFTDCDDTVMEDITVYNSAGYMVVVFPRCNNFTIRRYRVVVPQGSHRFWASNIDGIHLLGLTGECIVEDCYFDGLGDDALNIHSTSGFVDELTDGRIKVSNHRFNIPLEENWCRKGDKISVYGADFLRKGKITVKEYDGENIYFDDIDGVVEVGDVVGNDECLAKITVTGTTVRNSRARALLFQTNNVTVRDCYFFGMSAAAILLSPDIRVWHEVGPCENVLIENCIFDKCAMSKDEVRHAVQGAVMVRSSHDSSGIDYPAGVHKNIVIKNNKFVDIPASAVCVCGTDGVTVTDNVFLNCSGEGGLNGMKKYDVFIKNCKNIKVENNQTENENSLHIE